MKRDHTSNKIVNLLSYLNSFIKLWQRNTSAIRQHLSVNTQRKLSANLIYLEATNKSQTSQKTYVGMCLYSLVWYWI